MKGENITQGQNVVNSDLFAVLNASQGPPILNPVLPAEVLGQPVVPQHPPVPIGPRDTPLGNQAPPTSPVQVNWIL